MTEIDNEKMLKCIECLKSTNKEEIVDCLSRKYIDCLKNADKKKLSYNECDIFIHEGIKVMFTDKLYDYLKK